MARMASYGAPGYPGYGGFGAFGAGATYGETGRIHRPTPRARFGQPQRRDWWDRTTDEVMSWFGDEDAARRRRADHRGRGPSNYTRSDDRIREDVNDNLTDDWAVDARNVTVAVKMARSRSTAPSPPGCRSAARRTAPRSLGRQERAEQPAGSGPAGSDRNEDEQRHDQRRPRPARRPAEASARHEDQGASAPPSVPGSVPSLRAALEAGRRELLVDLLSSRSRPCWLSLSARATSTSCVFEARSSHQPSRCVTRTPSVSSTSASVPASRVLTSSIAANLRLSSTWKRSSGVLTIAGIAPAQLGDRFAESAPTRRSAGRRRKARRRSRNNRRRRRCARSSRRPAAHEFPSFWT